LNFEFIIIDIHINTLLSILFYENFRKKMKEVLGAKQKNLYFEAHTDTAKKRGSCSKHLFMI